METVYNYTPYTTYGHTIYGVHVFEEIQFKVGIQYVMCNNIIYCSNDKVYLQVHPIGQSSKGSKETKTISQLIEYIDKLKRRRRESKSKSAIQDYTASIEFYDEILHKMRDYQLDIFIEPDKKRLTDYDYLAMAC